jgi:GTP-binding protein HflX
MLPVLLIQLSTPSSLALEYDLEELSALALQVGLEPVEKMTQHLSKPSAFSAIGKGKLEEIKALIETTDIHMVVFYNELSATQMRNLEDVLNVEVIDRTMLILELLSQRAQSNLAKRLVSIAQMKYLLPRLSALNEITDRQQGGIGLKGPGETKLELSRRNLEQSIKHEEKHLRHDLKVRAQNRKQRKRNELKTVAIIGYTNAGKSTLLNAFTSASKDKRKTVLSKDQVFSTLDTASRKVTLSKAPAFIMTDTVGFVSNMPSHLRAAFNATLEETTEADLILIVLDASNPYLDEHLKATEDVMNQLNLDYKPKLYVLNKTDKLAYPEHFLFHKFPYVKVSLMKQDSTDALIQQVVEILYEEGASKHYLIPYSEDNHRAYLRKTSVIMAETHHENGTLIHAKVPGYVADHLKPFEY